MMKELYITKKIILTLFVMGLTVLKALKTSMLRFLPIKYKQ